MPSSIPVSVVSFALALAGVVGTPGASNRVVVASASLMPDVRCVPLGDNLPALSTVLDSASLVVQVNAIARETNSEYVVSVRPGTQPTGRLLNANQPSSFQESLVAAVIASLKPGLNDSPQQFRVRVKHGANQSIAVEPSVVCQPTLETRPEKIFPVSVNVQQSPLYGRTVAAQPFNVRMRVNSDGVVTEITGLGGTTGNSQDQAAVRQQLLIGRFQPATVDGAPADVWLTALTKYGIDLKILKTELAN